MKILDQTRYSQLRGEGNKLIGRLRPVMTNSEWIYFQINKDQQSLSSVEILHNLSLISLDIKNGKYEVFRHWTRPEVELIEIKFKSNLEI